MTITHRLEALAHGVLGPIVLGGQMHLVPPFGAALALSIEDSPRIVDDDLRTRVDVARVRVARTLVPIDTLTDVPAADWALAAGLNDLLQATNHHLSGPFTRGRHVALVASVEALLQHIAPPTSLGDAVARHATFARVLEVMRKDTKVRWWSGSASFRGQPPPPRLFAWKDMRRVRTEESEVAFADLSDGVSVPRDRWLAAMALWLSRSPLTDVATLARGAPTFAWSASTLALVATPLGSKLAARALSFATREGEHSADVTRALEASVDRMAKGDGRHIALGFAEEAAARIRGLPKDAPATA